MGQALEQDWLGAYRGRRVLLTGHTGFKGGWLALWLHRLGAEVTGYALAPSTTPALFEEAGVERYVRHVIADIRDVDQLERTWVETQPEVVFHLAAQALVRRSYDDPLTTVSTNVLGSAHVLEVARRHPPRALVMITSDKCYENHEWQRGYHEDDQLGGRDVYSASKAAAEILISSYARSFLSAGHGRDIAVASARAGNVIGGGDWSPDRVVPDCMRALFASEAIPVRNPGAVRPWQHVLEPLSGYLLLGHRLLSTDPHLRQQASQAWNFGPEIANTRTVGELVDALIAAWGSGTTVDLRRADAPHEAGLLRLDITKAKQELGWAPRWDFSTAVARTVAWYQAAYAGEDVAETSFRQIADYEAGGA